MSDPRIAIIGAGNLSTRRIYPNVGAAGAERNAGRFGGRPFEDLDVMLDTVKPDGVIVCVGPEAHAKIATRVLWLGYPVYTEKPPASTAADALAVARVAAENRSALYNSIQEALFPGE